MPSIHRFGDAIVPLSGCRHGGSRYKEMPGFHIALDDDISTCSDVEMQFVTDFECAKLATLTTLRSSSLPTSNEPD
jgi:hypothetical protein